MEFTIDPTVFISLCAISLIAGFIDAIVGGGGMLTVPALLTAGLPPHIALGTNKLAASFGSLTSSFTFYRKKLFNIRFWRLSLLFTAVGAVIGTLMVNYISTGFLEKSLPVLIVLTAIYTLFCKKNIESQNGLPKVNQTLKIKQSIQGFTLGFYDGLAGPGTGAFWTVSSSILYKFNILLNLGLARSANFVSNILSLITFIYLGHVNFLLGLSMGLFIMCGSWLGARSAIKFGGKFIRPLFIIVVILISINLTYNAWG